MAMMKIRYTVPVVVETVIYADKDADDEIFYDECEKMFEHGDIKEVYGDDIDIDWGSIQELED